MKISHPVLNPYSDFFYLRAYNSNCILLLLNCRRLGTANGSLVFKCNDYERGQVGKISISIPSMYPFAYRKYPAAATIAALSVQYFRGGM
jgi:hypothetical protein